MNATRFYYSPSRDYWSFRTPSEFDVPLSEPNDWRPLVVIDPEDREAIERIRERLNEMSFSAWACGATDCLQIALREFADPKPPKPEEPTGLGAVVEDAKGVAWTRLAWIPSRPWMSADEFKRHYHWGQLADPVRVLSEGVRP